MFIIVIEESISGHLVGSQSNLVVDIAERHGIISVTFMIIEEQLLKL